MQMWGSREQNFIKEEMILTWRSASALQTRFDAPGDNVGGDNAG